MAKLSVRGAWHPIDNGEQLRKDLFARRSSLHQKAVDYAERNFDENVVDVLESASLNEGDHRLKSAVVDRLRVAFNSRLNLATDEALR